MLTRRDSACYLGCMMHRLHYLIIGAALAACDPMSEPLSDAESVNIDLSLPLSNRPTDDLIALEWSVARMIEAQLDRSVFVATGDPRRPMEKFRLPDYEDETELIECDDDGSGGSCTCFGVTSCKSDRWASVCTSGTEDCGVFSCSCEWKKPQK